jgi:hypothetical protein
MKGQRDKRDVIDFLGRPKRSGLADYCRFSLLNFFLSFSPPLEHRQSVGLDPPHNRAEGGAEQLVLLLRWSRGGADGGGGGLSTLPRVNRGTVMRKSMF